MRNAMRKEKGFLTHEAYDLQNEFIDNVLRPEGFTWKELCALAGNDNYIAFIAGSDQIWNASIRISPIYFLQFAPKSKRIALAPSFGIDSIPAYNKKTVQEGLEGFKKIAVREQTGEKIVKQLCDVPTIQLTDPVFLLDGSQWISFAENIKTPLEPYVFVHFLNKPSKETVFEIKNLAKRTNTMVLCFSYNYEEYSLFEKKICWDGSPQEYVSLIHNAAYICTDSFHSSVFSIIMHKRFYTFPRQHLHTASQSSRITDLLARYGLEKRYVKKGAITEDDETIDWNAVDEEMNAERNILKDYLNGEIRKRN